MQYNRLGKAGIKISELSYGSWVTFSGQMDLKKVKECMHFAFDHGINFFDNAEAYAGGKAEELMGQAAKDFKREDLVISTKIFWGGNGPNDQGLSRKHVVEGLKNCLHRLQMDYVDLLFCHRPDPNTPIEETVITMDMLIRQGYAFYWGTSEWSAEEIEEAFTVAEKLHCIPPSMEQPQYNMFERTRFEREYASIFSKHHYGSTIWSPLNSGILTGKYNNGIPKGSRLEKETWLQRLITPERIAKVKALTAIAEELGSTLASLAIAWCLKNKNVSTVILGATSVDQLKDNLAALEVKANITDDVMKRIDGILGN